MPTHLPLTLAQDATAPPESAGPETTTPAGEAGEALNEGMSAGQDALNSLMAGDVGGATSQLTEFLEAYGPQLMAFGARVVGAIVLFIIALIISGILKGWVTRGLKRTNFDETLTKFFGSLTRWMVLLLALLMCISIFGFNITTFAAILGAAGLAVGLAFQGTLSSFAAGIMLLTFRPFKVGDVCVLNGQLCKIAEISLFTTNVDSLDNRRIIMPNAAVFGSTIEVITYHPQRRVEVLVGASYDADIDKTREVLETVCKSRDDVIEGDDRGFMVVLDQLGGSSVDWKVWYWAEAADFLAVKQSLTRDIKMAFDEAGIGIPYPQMDVHLDGQVTQTQG
ncbi:MAG: mechanosensitive ion channel domain-containing protein [Planctomycetota bacterium]